MSVPASSSASQYTPLGGPQQLTLAAATGGSLLGPVLQALAWTAALLLVAVLAWRRRLRVHG
jgi:hypothetical protein